MEGMYDNVDDLNEMGTAAEIYRLNDAYYLGDDVAMIHKIAKQHKQGLLTNDDFLATLKILLLAS
jgi:hypothetical protein